MEQKFADDVRIIVEEGSISDAAKRLSISQPALSSRIRKLEDAYGIQIFKRNRRPVTLTDEGKMYLEYVEKAKKLDKEFRTTVSQSESLMAGELTIGGTHLYTTYFLPSAVAAFSEHHPRVTIHVVNETAPNLTAMAAKGALDLFITNDEKRSAGITYEVLYNVNMFFCVPDSYAVNSVFERSGFDVRKLSNHPFIMLDKGQYMGSALRVLLRRYGVNPACIIHADQALTAYELARAGAGIALMYGRPGDQATIAASKDTTRESATMRDDPRLCRYTTQDPEMQTQISVAYAENTALSSAATEFIRILKDGI